MPTHPAGTAGQRNASERPTPQTSIDGAGRACGSNHSNDE
ncbi:hypothetical protein CSC46_2418 [Pseudomonas aeruginosa]|nr:hypothetical protein CSC46_2418 [Pseudomonas aeruginosa]